MKYLSLIALLSLLLSCGTKRLTASEYLEFYSSKKDSFTTTRDLTSMVCQIKYVPVEYFAARSYLEGVPAAELKEELSADRKISSYSMKLTFKNGNLYNQLNKPASEQMKFYAVDFKNTIKAVLINNDTVQSSNYLFESASSIGNQAYFEFEIGSKVNQIQKFLFYTPYLKDSIIEIEVQNTSLKLPELKLK